MEIKKGLVEWNDRKDIPCTYVEIEDGTKYFFKQDLINGNHLVTTSLLETVDQNTKPKFMGLMDTEGNLLIPCVNTSIRVVDNNLLLVEPTEPVSDNVKEANSLRMDPLSATRLVSTPAQIKETIPAKDYIFYNQFSEVTICDIDGNNKVNNEYYSFVARDGDKLYMAKNNIGTEVKEFSITDKKFIEKEVVPVEEPVVPSIEGTVPAVENSTKPAEVSTEVVVPVQESISQPVEVSTEAVVPATDEVVPSELSNVFGIANNNEETVAPVVDNVGENFSFGEIAEETPTVEVDGGEGVEVREEDYTSETELEKSLKASNERMIEGISSLNEFENSNPYEFNNEFKPDSIDRSIIDDNKEVSTNDSIETEKSVVDDVSRILGGFRDAISAKTEEIRAISEERDELRKENAEMKNALKESEARKSRDAMTISSLEDELEEMRVALANSDGENQKLRAKIETLEDTNDLYKRREEETRRNMKVLARAVKIYQAADGNMMDEEESYSRKMVA